MHALYASERRLAMPFDRPAVALAGRSYIRARQTLVLENARGTLIAVDHGCLWITQEGDRRDIVLTDGMRFAIDRSGRTVAVAEENTRLRVTRPQLLRQRLRARLRRVLARHATSWARPLIRRLMPYY